MKNGYTCTCKNDTFRVVDKRVRYSKDTRTEQVLACAKCSRQYNPQFVTGGGLTKPKPS